MFVLSFVYIKNVKTTCRQVCFKLAFEPVSVLFFSFSRNDEALSFDIGSVVQFLQIYSTGKQNFNQRAENLSLISLHLRRHLLRSFFRKRMILFTLPVIMVLIYIESKVFYLHVLQFYSVEHLFTELCATVIDNLEKQVHKIQMWLLWCFIHIHILREEQLNTFGN